MFNGLRTRIEDNVNKKKNRSPLKRLKMKRLELLFVFFSLFGLTWSQNTITLTFSGKNENNAYVRMDSVKVVNLTQNWEEILIIRTQALQ